MRKSVIKLSGKYVLEVISAIIGLAILVLYSVKFIDDKAMIAAIGGLITIYLEVTKQKVEHDNMFKELFNGFNSRYTKDTNDLLQRLKDSGEMSFAIGYKDRIIDYFNLCAEEFLWYKKGRISTDVWRAWRSGILENLRIQAVGKLYEEETNTPQKRASYYGLVEELGFYPSQKVSE